MMFKIDDQMPIHTQLCNEIISRIISGEYPPASRIPSVRELATEARVNPNTMQKALIELESLHIIYTQRTNGKFVTDDLTLLKKLKDDVLHKAVDEFIEKITKLGINKEEVIKVLDDKTNIHK